MSTIASYLSMFHQPGLRIFLRITKEVLDMAGMVDEISANKLEVASFITGNTAISKYYISAF